MGEGRPQTLSGMFTEPFLSHYHCFLSSDFKEPCHEICSLSFCEMKTFNSCLLVFWIRIRNEFVSDPYTGALKKFVLP